ncbi:MAG: alcohol dehydrogenase catalytic domain-containing protein [Acidobacteriota bacterium]
MRAAIIHAPLEMKVGDWETPRPRPGEALISVAAAGICAGDMYFYLGKNPYACYPQICGHEIAGVVIEVAGDGSDLRPGTRVVVEPFIGCGACYPCRIGKSNCCTRLKIIGVHQPGGYAELLTAPAKNLHVVPDDLSLATASFAEPVAIALQACRRAELAEGERVLVLGSGPIGLALIEVARARGARVAATDLLKSNLDVAAQLGAEVLPADEKLTRAVLDLTGGEGMPVVIEATGNPRAIERTVELVAAGGRIVIVGLIKQGIGVMFPGLDFTRKEMTVLGSRASVNCFPEALSLLSHGYVRYPEVTARFDLWEAPRIFAELAARPGSVHKAILVREGFQ